MLNGIDISSHQGNINVQKVSCDFVIVKATGGTGYVNPYCDSRYQLAKKSGKLLGFYHYAHEIGFQGTAIEEANFFLQNTKNYFGEAIPILDWESDNKHDVNWAYDFLNHIYKETGVKGWLYTYSNVINTYDFSKIAKADFGLWIANYKDDSPITGYRQPSPPISNNFPITACYQYSSNTWLPDFDNRLDANVFYGNRDTWLAYCGKATVKPDTEPQPPVEEIPVNEGEIEMKKITTTVNGVRLRNSPNVSENNVIAELPLNSDVNINAVVFNDGFVWGVQPRGDGTKGYIDIGVSVTWVK